MMLDTGNIFPSIGNGTPFQPVSGENATIVDNYIKFAGSSLNKALVAMSSLLSMLGSFIIIASFAAWKDIRTTSRKILLFLSISDFLTAISNFIGTFAVSVSMNQRDPQNTLCVAQSFVTNSVSIASFLWTQTLAVYLYLAILKNKQALAKKFLPYIHVINWTIGPVINVIALKRNMLGFSAHELTGGWCWIYQKPGDKPQEVLWLTLDAKAIEFLVYTSVLVIYILIRTRIHAELKLRSQQGPMRQDVLRSAKSADQKLLFVPILLILGRFWGTLRFLLYVSNSLPSGNKPIGAGHKALLALQGIGDSSQGFLNWILFCFLNPKVYDHLKECTLYYICRRREKELTDPVSVYVKADENSLNGDEASLFTCPSSPGNQKRPLLDPNGSIKRYGGEASGSQ
eukprot:Seg1433.2 transcript_id=Seg1433.2/GoldUCD/mRNA.D3Y31 product="G-protein coupled receptor 157" protein_id=Seg1433.2/GoldUCD/D3Y31